jgi:signal transduction histidine kinase
LLGLLGNNRLVDRETIETYKTMSDAVAAMELSLSNALHLLRANAVPEVRRERLYLNEMLGQIARLFRAFAQSNQIRFREDLCLSPVYLQGDDELVRRIVVNLVSNACKYTPPGGTVTLKLEDKSDAIVISVADTGVGIAEKDRELIFTRFYRVPAADGKTQRIPGSGLGLAIAKRAAEIHNAKLWVESQVGQGSVFHVSFPKQEAATA